MPTPDACRSPSEAQALTRCPLCGYERFTRRFEQGGSSIVRCDGCGLVRRNLQPSDAALAAICTDSDSSGPGTTDGNFERELARLKRATAAGRLDRIERYAGWSETSRRGKRLLEIGSGPGHFLVEAEGRGYDVAGLECSPTSVERANARLGRTVVRQGTVESAPEIGGEFDVCVLNGIEHARDPIRAMGDVRGLLRPGGIVFLATPRLDGWTGRSTRDRWVALEAERLFFFDRVTLESALVRAGFERVRLAKEVKTLSRQRRIRAVGSGVDAIAQRAVEEPIDSRRARLSVVMPVFNEKKTFSTVIDLVLQKTIPDTDIEVVIVESQSVDGTREDVARVADHPRVKVVWQERPRGKGHAVRAGLAAVTGDFVLIQDADLEYDIDDYDQLVEPLRTFRRAFVLGIRHGKDGHRWKVRQFTDRVFLGQWMNLGHLIFTTLFNVVYGQRLSDPFTMFKVFRRECLSGLTFEANKFDFDWELAGKLVRCGYEPLELPVNYTSRSFSEGKKVTLIRDPLTWIRACFKYRVVKLKDQS